MTTWTNGNELALLENGEEFFPAVFDAIRQARHEILLETFIWEQDNTGRQLSTLLTAAAERGVRVHACVDGFGTPGFTADFLAQMTNAGITIESYDSRPTFLWKRINILCRLHRKIVVVDEHVAFVGGLNFSDVHLRSYGPESMQDYAVCVRGPIVKILHQFCVAARNDIRHSPDRRRRRIWLRHRPHEDQQPAGDGQALFLTRDNSRHRRDIETMYLAGIRQATQSITIANAYFFPGFRFIWHLCRAAKRGVDVTLILQGKPDQPLTINAASIVYADLLASDVRICRYTDRPMHAKVAVIDDRWVTIGSSNLDPVSLGLNLEANLFVIDTNLNTALRNSLQRLIDESCEICTPESVSQKSLVRRLLLASAYHLTRRMHSWGAKLRNRKHLLKPMTAVSAGAATQP